MEKQKKQMLVMLGLVIVLILAYVGVRFYNQQQDEKAAEQETDQMIQVTNVDVNSIEAISYLVNGECLSFTKVGDAWQYDDDTGIDIDESQFTTLLEKMADMTAVEEITEYEDLADYGFDEPANVLTLTTDIDTITIYIGIQNDMTGQYYMKVEGNDIVYVVESSVANGYDMTIDELTVEEETEETEEIIDTVEETES